MTMARGGAKSIPPCPHDSDPDLDLDLVFNPIPISSRELKIVPISVSQEIKWGQGFSILSQL